VTVSWDQIVQAAIGTLSEEETHGSAVYLLPRILKLGDSITIDRGSRAITEPGVMVFVDLKPAANWAHPCRYLLFDASSGVIRERIEGQFPPDREGLRLIYRGKQVEDWMLLTDEPLE
jgi:hypothetical protein